MDLDSVRSLRSLRSLPSVPTQSSSASIQTSPAPTRTLAAPPPPLASTHIPTHLIAHLDPTQVSAGSSRTGLPSPPLSRISDPWSDPGDQDSLELKPSTTDNHHRRQSTLHHQIGERYNTGMEDGIGGLEGSWRDVRWDSSRDREREKEVERERERERVRDRERERENENEKGKERDVTERITHSLQGSTSKAKSRRDLLDPRLHVLALANIMDTSKGRDKVLKCAQYSIRTYLYLLGLIASVRPLSKWFISNRVRSKLAVSGLSLTRKCLLLLNPLHPLADLLSPDPTSAPALVRHLIDLTSAIADDVYCLSKLGLVSKRTGIVADRWANRFWLLTTLLGLYKLHVTTLPRLRAAREDHPTIAGPRTSIEIDEAQWTGRKLLCDLVFVSYDVFELSWLKEPVQCIAGLSAALISTSKLYDQHWRAGLGKG